MLNKNWNSHGNFYESFYCDFIVYNNYYFLFQMFLEIGDFMFIEPKKIRIQALKNEKKSLEEFYPYERY